MPTLVPAPADQSGEAHTLFNIGNGNIVYRPTLVPAPADQSGEAHTPYNIGNGNIVYMPTLVPAPADQSGEAHGARWRRTRRLFGVPLQGASITFSVRVRRRRVRLCG